MRKSDENRAVTLPRGTSLDGYWPTCVHLFLISYGVRLETPLAFTFLILQKILQPDPFSVALRISTLKRQKEGER